MDINNVTRSLPPLVEGKVHGYLKLVISEILWYRTRPGDVTVVASWWGESNSAHFRPVDTTMNAVRNEEETVETYAIKTNFDLFGEYLTNCGSIELAIVSETLNEIIGTAQVSDLHEIFQAEPYIQYCSVYNKVGTKIGDIPVNISLTKLQKGPKSPTKLRKKKSIVPSMLELNLSEPQFKLNAKNSSDHHNIMFMSERESQKREDNIYRSILKDKRFNINKNTSKFNTDVTDKLVAQVVERARRLRGELMKETDEVDALQINEDSLDSFRSSRGSAEDQQSTLYKYFMGTNMSRKNEKKALETLRSISPTPSLIDFATETIIPYNNNKASDKISYPKGNSEDIPLERGNREMKLINRPTVQPKEACPMDYVDSLRIAVESLTLNSAGYRRVKSSCITRGDGIPATVTYFVQYDAAFANVKKYNKKVINENKRPVKMTSKRQDGQVIYFNHEAVYDLPKARLELYMNAPLRFKIFNRHFDQRTPTELGIGSMYIGDAAASPTLSSTQKLAIVKKGIKIGELKVTIELGCDKIHFGKHFVEAIILAKENIPVLETSSNSSINSLGRYKCATGSESKPNSGSSGIASAPEQRQYNNSKSGDSIRNSNGTSKENSRKTDERIKLDIPRVAEEKTLLHGLIYIAEGRNLPAVNSYIICRALWRQDRASSRVCTDTINPFYNFHQIMPLIYGLELLERTRDNCIITEVYAKNPVGEDNLIGISKLSVHQLYVAFRDPLVLPDLLKSKYPVISVDGWVPITDPVTGRLCGELLALVALGTADQIALLEMTRGLRGIRNSPEYITGRNLNLHHEHQKESSMRTQECQTEISTVCEIKSADNGSKNSEELRDEQTAVLHTIVDRLAQALTVPKTITNQEAQTEFQIPTRDMDKVREDMNPRALSLNPSNSNSFSCDSFNDVPRENFSIARGIHRSVGVGAEFNEPVNQNVNLNYNSQVPPVIDSKDNDASSSDNDGLSHLKLNEESDLNNSNDEEGFRAVVEIEGALHLPTIELHDGPVEPSTYVTFEKLREGQNGITDVCPYNCNPKYDWRCDTKLPTELLTNEKMRLIMKVWRLIDPESNMSINMQKDMIIGFSAIDLSVLTAGFPMVSGWFHINDFAGKCNGQLKVCITPLDNISAFSKSCGNSSRVQIPPLVHSNFSSPFPQDIERMTDAQHTQTQDVQTSEEPVQVPMEGAFDIGLGLGDASMSFLSLSLKQKLTELDEIKQRLQSRLQDVTNTAFEDDFDNDFDFDAELDQEDNDNNGNNVETILPSRLPARPDNNAAQRDVNQANNCLINGNAKMTKPIEGIQYVQRPTSDNNTNSLEANLTDTGYSSGSNIYPSAPVTNGHSIQSRTLEMPNKNPTSVSNGQYVDPNYPARGTRMHISHLLDKLSMQLTTAPAPITNLPMKRNIMDLISSLRRNNNNFSNDIKCNRQANVRTVPTQTDTNFISNSPTNNSAEAKRHNASSNEDDHYNEDEIPAKTQKREKISTIVREELIADDQNDTSEYDDLTSHLMTSSIRHMDVNNILNPLLYPHVIPDISDLPEIPEAHATGQGSTSRTVTPENETIDRLDYRYAEGFSATINKSLGRLRNLLDVESSSSRMPHLSSTTESSEVFRVTPSALPGNTDGNIDVTVIHKPYNDDLMASNSVESTTTVSLDNTMQTGTEIDDASSLNSSETSVSAVSRQAPDGGNTLEDPSKPILLKHTDQSDESSSEN